MGKWFTCDKRHSAGLHSEEFGFGHGSSCVSSFKGFHSLFELQVVMQDLIYT